MRVTAGDRTIRDGQVWFMMITLVLVIAPPRCLESDVVWVKGSVKPVYGRILEQDAQVILFQTVDEDGVAGETVRIARAQIEIMVQTIDEDRLGKLSINSLADYQDYAEELAVQKVDPLSRELAVRLYTIAAYHSENDASQSDLYRSCLMGLAELADPGSDRQKKWLDQLNLLDGKLPGNAKPGSSDSGPTSDQRETARQIVRMIRQGEGVAANRLLDQPDSQNAVSLWSDWISLPELKRLALLNRLDLAQLNQLLQVELAILAGETSPDVSANSMVNSFGQQAQRDGKVPMLFGGMALLADFDPEKSVYRDGVWVKPNPKSTGGND